MATLKKKKKETKPVPKDTKRKKEINEKSKAFRDNLILSILAVLAIMDDTIHDEDYILQNYDCPILAKVPNLLSSSGKNYKYRHYGYYYQSKHKSQQ